MNVAFAGFRHGHIFSILKWAEEADNIKITAAWEENEQAREDAQKRGVVFTHDDYDEMLRDESIDIVAVGDYFAARGDKIIKALKAGKHVISDKPICTSLAQLDEIERLSRENNKKVGCMLDLRYLFCVNKAKEIVSSGTIGEVHNISFGGQHPLNYGKRAAWYFESGKQGGTINDIAVHGIDLIAYITGKRLQRVYAARCWNAYATEEPDFLDSAQFMAEFDGGTGVIADVSYSVPSVSGFSLEQCWRFDFWGDKGVIAVKVSENSVELAMKDSEGLEIFKGEDIKSNPLADLLLDIGGTPAALDTAAAISAARDTLTLQKFADSNCLK